jgi:hypothetical protein
MEGNEDPPRRRQAEGSPGCEERGGGTVKGGRRDVDGVK